MKKLILFLTLLIGFVTVKAQSTMTSAAYPANTVDTVVNTATKYLMSSVIKGKFSVSQIMFYAAKISGTVAGTATLQGSLDGSNWYTVGSAFTLTDVATQCTSFKVTDPGEVYYRIAVTGTGTMSNKIYAKYVVR